MEALDLFIRIANTVVVVRRHNEIFRNLYHHVRALVDFLVQSQFMRIYGPTVVVDLLIVQEVMSRYLDFSLILEEVFNNIFVDFDNDFH